ncbi:glyoxalase III HchA [Methylobacterium platani]|uniref:Chaperone protein HchA n=2 Tax=Methylobacterium platani TaxID=427683 RepID=A0A179RQF9_9HYPH|nr:glyoxalase III HchA [Methylobacterium platani]KMO10549.1 chaperone protein HchA [Methylobacterium platani JCM 14648]OAS10313.1 chaperone protein HchA [Methylobacterium platani]
MASSDDLSKQPTPDVAEDNAFFPSAYSLGQFTSGKSGLDGASYPNAYTGGQHKILMIATDERYLLMQNGTFFSTGNHPVEMLLPMYHLDKAGFAFDIATISGEPAKLELWAYPKDDAAVASIYEKYKPQLKSPLKLADVVANALGPDSAYVAVFIPGGHGALNGVPFSTDVKKALDWALRADKHIISLCHGPAALLSAKIGEEENPFKGYKICSFPDAIDAKTPELGYMPGAMPWFIGERLRADGLEIVNTDIKGTVHQDRKLITGDSPFASNNLGKAAAEALLAEYGAK